MFGGICVFNQAGERPSCCSAATYFSRLDPAKISNTASPETVTNVLDLRCFLGISKMSDDILASPPEKTKVHAEVKAAPPPPQLSEPAVGESGEVHLLYQIEGSPNEVPVFELARTLEALGNVIQEADDAVSHDANELAVRVRPFQEGSFVMDLVLSVIHDPTTLFALSQPEAIARIKTVLEYLGLIKKTKEVLASLIELLQFLGNGKPAKVEPAGPDTFNYFNKAGQSMPVNQPIHTLVNNGTIQQFIFPAVAAPLQREGVEAIRTALQNQPLTAVRLPKVEIAAIKAYSEPEPEAPEEEVVENFTTEFLNPKAGTYGDTEGTWLFMPAGQSTNPIRARITDDKFLARFGRGAIRFYHDDVLKVKLKTEVRMKDGKTKKSHEIVEVFDYQAAPVKRPRRKKK